MALIKDAKGRRAGETPSGYERLLGNKELGQLISKVQSAVISTGSELERDLEKKLIGRKDVSIGKINPEFRNFRGLKKDSTGKTHNIKIDVVIKNESDYELIELKDGDTFDTKKVAGELQSLNLVKDFLIKKGVSEKNIKMGFCSFNAENHDQIEKGAKGLLNRSMAITGRELCEKLGLNFGVIVEERKKHQKENMKYFEEEIEKIKKNKKS